MKKPTLFRKITDAKGSILVGAIALSILMAIAGLGFLQVSTSGLNNDTEAFRNLKAMLAAESGLNFGLRYLRASTAPGPFFSSTANNHYDPFGTYPTSVSIINGMVVQVVITTLNTLTDSICANVFDSTSGNNIDNTKFRLRTGYRVTRQSYTSYSSLFGSVWRNNPEFKDCNGNGSPYRGFSGGTYFYGRVHMNCFIEIHNPSTGKFLPAGPIPSLVTVANNPVAALNHAYPYTGGRNDYDTGVMIDAYCGGTGCGPSIDDATWNTGRKLDTVFTGRFLANQSMVTLPSGGNYATWSASSDCCPLPASFCDPTPVGNTSTQRRPTLVFARPGAAGSGTATFYPLDPNPPHAYLAAVLLHFADYNNHVICSNTSLNVYGKVDGAVTVATALNTNIHIVDDLIYADAVQTTITGLTNMTVPTTSTNILGLAPGRSIVFDNQWTRPTALGGGVANVNAIADQILNVDASILAVENPNDVNGNQGTEYWVNNTDQDVTGNVGNGYQENYVLRLFGNHVLTAARENKCSDNTGSYSWNGHTFNYDTRLATMSPPDYPTATTTEPDGSHLLLLDAKNWFVQYKL